MALAAVHAFYTYVAYPGILFILSLPWRRPGAKDLGEAGWPTVSISVPVYNEEHQIADTIESLLSIDYPPSRRQILIVSDASDDGTDAVVEGFTDRGVQLVRQPERRGKTAAEGLASQYLTGEIVVNTDASIRIHPHALKALVEPFRDPRVGLASGRDVSVGRKGREANQGEKSYVGYEMWIRDLETKLTGIVGASGCLYAIRRDLHGLPLPDALSRDFAAALNAREAGYRSVSVRNATCSVPRAASLRREYARKVRTIARGMQTLIFKRRLMNPLRHGLFAWMLFSHKVLRWLLPWSALAAFVALGVLSTTFVWMIPVFLAATVVVWVGLGAWLFGGNRRLPSVLALPAYLLMSNVAAMKALVVALLGDRRPTWEPTRREV